MVPLISRSASHGQRLVDLLIEHGVRLRSRAIEVLTFDPDGLLPEVGPGDEEL